MRAKRGPSGPHGGDGIFVPAALVLVAGSIWLLGALGVFRAPNAYVYDLFLTLVAPENRPADLLIVEASPTRTPGDDVWIRLTETLQPFEPTAIAFTFTPGGLSAGAASRSILGRPASRSPVRPDEWMLAPAPQAHRGKVGLVVLPEAERGIVRRQRAFLAVAGETRPTLEWLTSRAATSAGESDLRQDGFLVDYRGGRAGLPKVTLDQVVAGHLVETLVRDKVVLVGLAPKPGTPGIHTPLFDQQEPISALEFHGFALRTLLDGQPLREPGPIAAGVLLVLVSGAGALVYRRVKAGAVLGWMLLVGAGLGVAGFAVFFLSGSFLPVADLLMAQALLALLIWRQRQARQEEGLRALLRRLSARLQERLGPTAGKVAEGEIWPQIARMLEQAFELRRAVLLERDLRSPELRVAAAIGASPHDFEAMSRDPGAAPYAQAVPGAPLQLDPEQLTPLRPSAGEQSHLLPLAFAGETLGYWAFTVDVQRVRAADGILPAATACAAEVGELLHVARLRRRDERARARSGVLRQLTEGARVTEREVRQAFEVLARRLNTFEAVLASVSHATAVYDVFGQCRYANPRMHGLLRTAGLVPGEASALDLLVGLAGLPVDRGRALIRSVTLAGQQVALATSRDLDGRSFLLSLAPVAADPPESDWDAADAGQWKQRSLLCELLDVTPVRQLLGLKETMTRQLDLQLRNDLESMTLAANLLGDQRLPEARRGRVLDMMQGALERSRERLASVTSYLQAADQPELLEVYPLDPREPIRAACAKLDAEAARRRVRLRLDFPEFVELVLAGGRELEHLVGAILALLIQDAREDSELVVRMQEQTVAVTLSFANTGFGLPKGRLLEYVTSVGTAPSREMQTIHAGLRHLERWGGDLDAGSKLGEGLSFHLRLRKLV